MTKQKLQKLKTPAGAAKYPHLATPDTKFDPNGPGTYHLKVILQAGQETAEFIGKLEAAYEASYSERLKLEGKKTLKRADKGWKQEIDEDTGEPTGNWEVGFKQKAQIKSRAGKTYDMKISVFGPDLKPLDPKIGSGSTVKVAFEVFPFYTGALGAGVSLRLQAVQVLKLVPYGDRSADSFGFEAEEVEPAVDESADTMDSDESAGAPSGASF